MPVTCPKCGDPHLVQDEGASGGRVTCATCRTPVDIRSFPGALVPEAAGARSGRALPAVDGGAECFFCVGYQADDVCSSCGRFICGRCAVDWAGRQVCMSCVHALREIKGDDGFQSRRTLYDNLALSVIGWPIILIPFYGLFFSVMASPITLYWVVRHWKGSRGMVPRGRTRLVLAGIVSVLLLGGTLAALVLMISALGSL